MNRLCACAAILLAASSCDTSKNVAYLQDIDTNVVDAVDSEHGITIQPKDMLSIVVTSKNPELSAMFNLPTVSYQSGSEITAGESTAQQLMGYVVDEEGFIDFPVIGKIKVSGMNRWELQDKIKNEISGRNLLKDMVVTVEFMNLCVAVLGEVNTPGRYAIERDRTTILDVLSQAGDLTIYGNRTNVMVMRKEGDTQRIYSLDLTSGSNIYSSPAYYVQQNDVVYVEPNSVRARQSTVNGNNVRSTAFWISLASLLTSVAILVFN